MEANRNTQSFTNQIRYSEVGKNFNPEMGFVKRLGYRKVLFRILNRTRPKDFFGILELRPHITYWGYWKLEDGFQETGFLHVDNQTLYFSSDTHLGLGGLDIFYSKKDSLDNWQKPVNIGYPISPNPAITSFFNYFQSFYWVLIFTTGKTSKKSLESNLTYRKKTYLVKNENQSF